MRYRTVLMCRCSSSLARLHEPEQARKAASVSRFSSQASTPGPEPSGSSGDDFRFHRRHRLTRGAELQAVAREGKRLRTAHLDVRVIASPRSHCRVGFIVAKYDRSSVERNRVKRRLRELTRRELLGTLRQLRPCPDVVIRAKPEAYEAPMAKLQWELADLGTRIARLVGAMDSPTAGNA